MFDTIAQARDEGSTSLALDLRAVDQWPAELFALDRLEDLTVERAPGAALPPALQNLVSLQILALQDGETTELPAFLAAMPSLRELSSLGGALRAIAPSLAAAPALERLRVVEAELDVFPDELWAIANLCCVGLERCGLRDVSDAIAGATSLQYLDLTGNRLRALGALTMLKALGISFNPIEALPESVAELCRLEELRLSKCRFRALPDELFAFPNLKNLDLYDIPLIDPAGDLAKLGALSKLETLILSSLGLVTTPRSVFELPRLIELELSWNWLSVLDDAVGDLKNLERLDLAENCIATLPASLFSLPKLSTLEVENNPLKALPDAIGTAPALELLHVARCEIERLPDALFDAPKLTELDVSSNPITTLPSTIGRARALRELNLLGCGLRHLPPALFELDGLKRLRVAHNRLRMLSPAIAGLQDLVELDANECDITRVPEQIGSLMRLEKLDLGSRTGRGLEAFGGIARLAKLEDLRVALRETAVLDEILASLPALRRLHLQRPGRGPKVTVDGVDPVGLLRRGLMRP